MFLEQALALSLEDPLGGLAELDKLDAEDNLADFVKQAWPILEPATELKWGWALDAICEHLEAVHAGDILRLLTTVPPGMMKSMLFGVFFPAWEWGPRGMPHLRYLGTAFKEDLALRDNLKCRRLIQSQWYQERWPVQLTGDQNLKTKFENVDTGFREAMAFKSMTGSRGDRVHLDDPLSVDSAKSAVERLTAEQTFRNALPSRTNNELSALTVTMQRLHERDIAGVILDLGLDYTHLNLPMEFEVKQRCSTSIGFVDPRKREGDLVFPERFSADWLEGEKKVMTAYAVAGQFQQRPAPREGGMFKREWLPIVPALPSGASRFVRGWDLAGTDEMENATASYTVGVLMALVDRVYYVVDVVRFRASSGTVERTMKTVASQDEAKYGDGVLISAPQDPGQAGKSQKLYLGQQLAGHNIRFSPETGDKTTRADPMSAQAEVGNVKLVRGPWNDPFIDELAVFDAGQYDDQVDAASRAFHELTKMPPPVEMAMPVSIPR